MPITARDETLKHLLETLSQRDIPLISDDIQWAFESVKTKHDITAWVKEYLNTETLLTKEELELYRSLSRKGSVSIPEEQSANARPIYDEELATAISSLESSTAVVNEQLKTLESQKEALLALQAQNKNSISSAQRSRQDLRKRRAQESSQLRLAIDESVALVKEQLSQAQVDADSARTAVTACAAVCLAGDDRALAFLSDLSANSSSQKDARFDLKSIDQWSRALVAFRASEVRSRVKAVYQTRLHDIDSVTSMATEDVPSQKEALKGELQTLFAEVASVAEMVVDHELRTPILQSVTCSKRERDEKQREHLNYILSTIQYMTSRLDLLGSHAQDLQALQHALNEIQALSSSDLHDPVPKREASPVKGSKTDRSGYRAGQPLLPPDAASVMPEAAKQLLRHLDISSLGNSTEGAPNVLRAISSQRQEALRDQYRSAELSADQELAEHLERCDRDLQATLGSLYANSQFKSVSLSNKALDVRLDDLGDAVERVGGSMAALDVEGAPEDARVKEKFVSKWAS